MKNQLNSSSYVTVSFFTILVFLITSCAPTTAIEECIQSEPLGFLHGLWHGCICVISFFISLFNEDVAIYAVNNNGAWYDFGFVLGAGILGKSMHMKKKK